MSANQNNTILTKSHSSSSLLLNNANLGWTQPSTGILVTPQPPIETISATRSSSTNELRTSRTIASNTSTNNTLDNFQTISLDNNKTEDFNFEALPDYLIGLQQMSIKDSLKTTIDNSINTSGTDCLPQTTNTNAFLDNSLQNVSQSRLISSPYSQQNYTSGNTSEVQSMANYYSQTSAALPQTQTLPQMSSAPIQPPKGLVSRDFKIKGPLRLYDPNHGTQNSPQNQMNTALNNSQTVPSVPSSTTAPFSPPLIQSPYNPSQQYTETHDLNAQTLYNPQQYESSRTESEINSYISPTTESINTSEWSEQPIMGQTNSNTVTDGYNYYTNYNNSYIPVVYHWFYQKIIENNEVWKPFSAYDSYNLENALINSENNGYGVVIATNGGRFDVNIYERLRRPVYWSEASTIVRRCSWFFKKEGHNRYAPYPEDLAAQIEDTFRDSTIYNRWNQRIEIPGQEVIVLHNFQSIYHYQLDHSMPDGWGSALENPVRPRLVHRGAHQIFDDIEEGESLQIDHLVFLIHGIGEICDFRFRSIVEVVDDFRSISQSLMKTHYKQYIDNHQLGRIELLPISWHSALHGEETGIDSRLKLITLNSIPKLRHFSNDTILDALFYTSPLYCQTIVDEVGNEINRLFDLFKRRNPSFTGSVALGGHSLGSLIVFDILAHQSIEDNNSIDKTVDNLENLDQNFQLMDIKDEETLLQYLGFTEYLPNFEREKIDFEAILLLNELDLQRLELPIGLQKKLLNFIEDYKQLINNKSCNVLNNEPLGSTRKLSTQSVNYTFESMGIGFPSIKYPKLDFNPCAFFAMGSPLAMFLTVRGIETIGADFRLPTCPAVFNIFHPFDPIAYRIEPMIDSQFKDIKPVLIPHHKGRKRMHLELKESITRMGSDLKQKFFDSLKYTWNSINEFARAHKQTPNGAQQDIDRAVNEMVEQQIRRDGNGEEEQDFGFDASSDLRIGSLNYGRRIDYVLQEKPIEIFNEYLFAMASHACYWESEDTQLLILRELYGQMGYHSIPQTQQQIQTPISSQSYDQQFIEQQFDNQSIHTNY